MKRVLVTGANGHVGRNLVRLLVERGYEVRATVRDIEDPNCSNLFPGMGVDVVEADLLKPESLPPALKGMDGLFQVAAVYRTHAKDPEKEIMNPSILGGANILKAARQIGIQKIVYTSSIAAVGSHAPETSPLEESQWNSHACSPYFIAKTRAERQAWAFAEESGMNMVVINPGAIIGPGFHRHTPSTYPFEQVLRRQLPIVLPTGFTFVDVRDVAKAHLLAYESDRARGRYLAVDKFLTMSELLATIKDLFPDVRIPKIKVPAALLPAIVLFDWLAATCAGAPRQVTGAMARELGGHYQRASSQKIRAELGWEPMDYRESIRDTILWIRKQFLARDECESSATHG